MAADWSYLRLVENRYSQSVSDDVGLGKGRVKIERGDVNPYLKNREKAARLVRRLAVN